MSNRVTDSPPPRFSVSQLPAEVDPVEKDFARLLTQALAPSFVLVKRLGAGGMGAVYLARDPLLRRLVAVKVLSPSLASDPEARARFEREGQAVAAISHPNVVNVHSVGELENGVPYIVMQYIEGPTLADRLKENGPLEARTAKHIIGEVASALAAAHKKGIIHRDIKPANILLDEDTGRSMVTDFGIAAVKERDDKQPAVEITQTGMAIGTPAYMSPEQLLAEPTTDKTDIYALGLLGYELFIAEGPYQVSSPKEIMAAHLRDTPRRLSTMRGDIDPELERLLENCLEKDPAKRPTAAEVEKRLQHGASILLEWPPPGLEKIRAQLRAAVNVLLIGAFAFSVPIVTVAVFGRESFIRQSLPPTMVLLALSGVGFVAFGAGLVGLRAFFKKSRALVAAGYGWGTLLETVADRRGDTGALITGAREYAELEPKRRSAMRRYRVLALVLRVVAGFAPIFGFLIGIAFARGSANAPAIVLWSSLLFALTLLACSRLIWWQEERTMTEPRRRLRSANARPTTPMDTLAETWTASFEQVSAGQRMRTGPRWSGKPIRFSVWGAELAAVAAALFIYFAFTLVNLVAVAQEIGIPKFANTTSKISRIRRLEDYRAPVDTTITPLRAGQALQAISRNGPGGTIARFEREPVITIPPQPRTALPPDPFPLTEGGWMAYAFRGARRGLTLTQRDYLRAVADNSAMEEFRTLARARAMDLPAAFWDLRDAATFMYLPIPRFSPVKAAAHANIAQAALDFADGRPADAERRLKEVVSVGFHLINDGHTLIENLIGAVVVSSARTGLVALYEATGRDRDARFLSTQNDPEPPSELSDIRTSGLEETYRNVSARVLDTTTLPGLRWELLNAFLAFQPCTDMHQVIFGPDSLHLATMATARSTMVRRPSDSAFFALAETPRVVPITAQGQRGVAVRSTAPVTRLLGRMTGNRQLEACISLFGG